MRYYVTIEGQEELAVDVSRLQGGQLSVSIDGQPCEVNAVSTGNSVSIIVGERVFDLFLEPHPNEMRFVAAGVRGRALVESERSRIGGGARRGSRAGGWVCAPMPGRVVKVLVAVGDEVAAGAPVIVVEAMKMENELCAEHEGVVAQISAAAGDNVDGGAKLVELAPVETEQS